MLASRIKAIEIQRKGAEQQRRKAGRCDEVARDLGRLSQAAKEIIGGRNEDSLEFDMHSGAH